MRIGIAVALCAGTVASVANAGEWSSPVSFAGATPAVEALAGDNQMFAALSLNEQPPAAADAPAAAAKAPISFWEGWKHNVDLGLNGASGNTEQVAVRGLVGAQRKTETMETKWDIQYTFANNDGNKSKSRGEANIFNNWYFGAESKWGFFAQGKLEYDEFQKWQWRASGSIGPSYTFIKDETTTLRGRLGLGGSYDWGKQGDEEFHPEADIGIDFAHTFKEGHKAFVTLDYYPSLDEFPAYRVVGQAGYEILLSKESAMTLKLGIQDRYDSTPGLGFKRNDVEYFVTLSFNF